MAFLTLSDPSSAQTQASDSPSSSQLFLDLNIPSFRLDVFRGADFVRTFLVAVGQPRYPTPPGDYVLSESTWNPWWYPPPSKWAAHEKITPPGAINPMGKVKMRLGGSFFIHASPATASIGSAASHGCIRMLPDDAVALARIVQAAVKAPIDDAMIDLLVATWGKTRAVSLGAGIPVRLRYDLAEVRRDTLMLYPDIYRRRKGSAVSGALQVLAEAGSDTTQLDRAMLRTAVRQSLSARVAVSLESLTSGRKIANVKSGAQSGRAAPKAQGKTYTSKEIADCGQ